MNHIGSSVPIPQIDEILDLLTRHRTDFLVMGGVAVSHHGFTRTTKDVDIIPAPDRESLSRLWKALEELEARPLALGAFKEKELAAPLSLDSLLDHGNWDLATRFGRLDVLQYVAGKLETPEDFAELRERAAVAHYPFGDVAFVGFDDLIDFKNIAGRNQDLIDIRALREARGETAS